VRHLTFAGLTGKSSGPNAADHSMQMHVQNSGEMNVHLHVHERRWQNVTGEL
jgi:hypothetical protein